MERKLSLLQGMVLLFQVAGFIVAFILGLIAVLGLGITLAAQPIWALFALFCLSALVFFSISLWRMLAAAHQLADELAFLPRQVHRVLPLLDRYRESCVVAALAWLVVPICVIASQVDLPGSVLPTLWLLLLALSFHLPASALRCTLPLAFREALPFPASRVLLGALLLLFVISSTGTDGWISLLCLLAFACIPVAIGLWLTVLSDLISP